MRESKRKIVSCLVLMVLVVSLFAPIGKMKEVEARNPMFSFYNGEWYNGSIFDQTSKV